MKRREKNTSHTVFSNKIILSLYVFLGIIILILLIKNSNSSLEKDFYSEKNSLSPTSSPPTQLSKSADLFDLISYKIPNGWKEKILTEPFSQIEITSPDYKTPKTADEYYSPWPGILKTVRVAEHVKDPSGEIERIMNPKYEAKSTYSDMKKLIIDGWEAASYHYNFEGHSLIYAIAQDLGLWEIRFYSSSLASEKKYQEEINSFIKSISFN